MTVRTFNLVNGHAAVRGHVSNSARQSDQTLMSVNDAIDEVLATARNVESRSNTSKPGQPVTVFDLPDERPEGTGTASGTLVAATPSNGAELFPDWKSLDLQTDFPRGTTDEGSCRICYERTDDGERLRFQSSDYGDLELHTHNNGTLTVIQELLELPPIQGKKPLVFAWT